MTIIPEKTLCEAPFPQRTSGFHGGKDVDIEGVTGSIPVTPTIHPPENQGFGQTAAKCPAGSHEPRAPITDWLGLSDDAHAASEALNNAGPTAHVGDRLLKGLCIDDDDSSIGKAYHSADDLRRYARGLVEIADWLDARASER